MDIPQPLIDNIIVLKEINFEQLKRQDELGSEYSFSEASMLLKEIFNDLSEFMDISQVLRLSTDTINKIVNLSSEVVQKITLIKEFVLKGDEVNAFNKHTQINADVQRLYQDDLSLLPQLIERAKILKLNPQEIEKQVKSASETNEEIKKIEN